MILFLKNICNTCLLRFFLYLYSMIRQVIATMGMYKYIIWLYKSVLIIAHANQLKLGIIVTSAVCGG